MNKSTAGKRAVVAIGRINLALAKILNEAIDAALEEPENDDVATDDTVVNVAWLENIAATLEQEEA